MDNPHIRPRLSVYQRPLAVPALTAKEPTLAIADTPVVHPQLSPKIAQVDFAKSAKLFKRSQIKHKLLKGLMIISICILVLVGVLAALGYVLNERYSGRALPYTYVGDISIGGLTQPEIKAALDKRTEEITVTLTEAGLVREVPATTFGANFDTQKASEQAITGFNPFSYLTKRTITVPVEVNERYVDGYLRLHVADMQTDSKNAEIARSKKELVIVPETSGFRTSTTFITEQLKEKLATLDNPTISLSAVTEKPTITQADLQDDVDAAKKMVATNVGVTVYGTTLRPTEDQKLSWLEAKLIPNSSEVQLQFSKTKIREYVFEVAKKYNTEAVAETIVTNSDGSRVLKAGKKGNAVVNIDEVAGNIYSSLAKQQNAVFAFTINQVDYQKVDKALLATLTAPQGATSQAPNATLTSVSRNTQQAAPAEQTNAIAQTTPTPTTN